MRLAYIFCVIVTFYGALVLCNPTCPNIKTCYNCEVIGTCVLLASTSSLITEEQCKQRLASTSIWSVEYDSLSGTCYQSNCDDDVVYKKGSVVHRKTCDTVCGDYTLLKFSGYRVNSSIPYDMYDDMVTLESCLSMCLTTNTSCAVLYEPDIMDCFVYTSCLDSCDIEHAQGWEVDVYLRQCEPEGNSNIALNKSTSMSTLWTDWGEAFTFRSLLGVDGDYTQDKYANSCFVTDWEIGPWWRVDLEGIFRINRIVLYNRLDSNIDRGHDIVVSMGMTESSLVVYDYLPNLYSTYPFTFRIGTVARFVQLQINASYGDHFHLCEVEVFGIPDCGSLPSPLNGLVFTNETTLNNDAVYSCYTGYNLTGSDRRICQADGIWSGSAPTCELVHCSALVPPGNGTVTASDMAYMSTATYNCSTGFVLEGSITTTCMSDGNWNASAPSCNIIVCGSLANPANGSVSVTGTTYMSEAIYTCLNGFSLSGNFERACQANGNWSGLAPSCSVIVCGSLANPSNGNVSVTGTTYMSEATYTCLNGFSLSGNFQRACQANGNWSGSAPLCNIIVCGSLANPANGNVSVTGTTYMNEATYTCLNGFSLSGNFERACQANGNWSGSAPSCSVIVCGSLANPSNGNVSVTGTTYMSEATYTCLNGFSLSGNFERACQANGNWSGSAPSCNIIVCGSLANPSNGNVSVTGTSYMSEATYTCLHGFSLFGNFERSCQANGNWSGSAPSCSVIVCGSLANPSNGNVSVTGTTYMSEATYTCLNGFSLSGNFERACQANGNWSGSAPSCNIIVCGSLANPANGNVSVTGTTYMSEAIYTCLNGFNLSGNFERACQANGNWSGSAPSCSVIVCGSLANPSNGNVSVTGTSYMSEATYTCLNGFSLSGIFERACQANGSWSGSAPSCSVIVCGTLPNPSNGNVSVTGTTYMSEATYTCLIGFELTGSSTRMCMSNGNWNGSAPSCVSSLTVTAANITAGPLTSLAPSSSSSMSRIYIMACICYPNKTFIGMTHNEIILHLIKDTKVDVKNTSLSRSKLVCREDKRESSKIMGAIGASILSTAFGIIICSDLIAMFSKLRGVNFKSNKVANDA